MSTFTELESEKDRIAAEIRAAAPTKEAGESNGKFRKRLAAYYQESQAKLVAITQAMGAAPDKPRKPHAGRGRDGLHDQILDAMDDSCGLDDTYEELDQQGLLD